MERLSSNLRRVLACPHCGGALIAAGAGSARCTGCGTGFGAAPSGQLDLRLRRPKFYPVELPLETPLFPAGGVDFGPLPRQAPAVDLSRLAGPCHLPLDLRSYFPRAKGAGSLALDLGCGTQVHQEVCEHAGFEYVGLDYAAPEAMILGDAQALPFRDASFEFVLSIAVLEHVRFPLAMMREAWRVLAPGGLFLGTVAFLEPFHADSHHHHTHLGTWNALQFGGFRAARVAPTGRFWPGLVAQAHMGLFPHSPRWLARALVAPLLALHKLWWRAGRLVDAQASEENRLLKNSGAMMFIATREEEPS
jgi:SAM-dependent methyltransferase